MMNQTNMKIPIGNFTTMMLPFNLASDLREKLWPLRVTLYEKYCLRLTLDKEILVVNLMGNVLIGKIIRTGEFIQQGPLTNRCIQIIKNYGYSPTKTIRHSEQSTGRCSFCDRLKDAKHGKICEAYMGHFPQLGLKQVQNRPITTSCARCGKKKNSTSIYCQPCTMSMASKKKRSMLKGHFRIASSSVNPHKGSSKGSKTPVTLPSIWKGK
jgi:hypothetical protein